MRQILRQDWLGLAVLALAGGAAITAFRPDFLSTFNLFVLSSAVSLSLVIALGQMIIIAIGQMNLALGAIGGLAAVAFAGMMDVWHLPGALAALLSLSIGMAAGLLNGVVTARSGLSAFVITLASLSMFKGLNLAVTKAQPFYGVSDAVKAFGNISLAGPLPLLAVPAMIVAVGLWILLRRLPLGRQILAVGGNSHAAALSGISPGRAAIAAHVISGALAAIAGMMAVARLQLGQPTIGDDWLIPSFAAPVIGGAALAGGHVSVAGTALGVLIVALITQALVLFAIDPYYVQLLLGLLILGAVGLNRIRELRAG